MSAPRTHVAVHSGAENFVLGGDASTIVRSSDRRATDYVLVVRKLLAGEVQFAAIRESVPPVIVDVLAGYVDLTADEFATQLVVDHEGGSDALLPCRVVRIPGRSAFGGARVRIPRLPQCAG